MAGRLSGWFALVGLLALSPHLRASLAEMPDHSTRDRCDAWSRIEGAFDEAR